MDYQAYNRARLNRRRIDRIDCKTVVFVVPNLAKVGLVGNEIRLPFKGTISDIYASCGESGGTVLIDIEKCSQADYDTVPIWHSILEDKVRINEGSKSTNTSDSYSIKDEEIHKNDHLRLNILEVGGEIKDIVLEITIDLYIEEY